MPGHLGWVSPVCLHVISQQGYSDWCFRDTCMNAFVHTSRPACAVYRRPCKRTRGNVIGTNERARSRIADSVGTEYKIHSGYFFLIFFFYILPSYLCAFFSVCVCEFQKEHPKEKKRGKKRMREIKRRRKETFTWKKCQSKSDILSLSPSQFTVSILPVLAMIIRVDSSSMQTKQTLEISVSHVSEGPASCHPPVMLRWTRVLKGLLRRMP